MSQNQFVDMVAAISRELESIKSEILEIRFEIWKMTGDGSQGKCGHSHGKLLDSTIAKAEVRLDMLENNMKVIAEVQTCQLNQTTRMIRELEADLSVRIDDSQAAIRQMAT